MLYMNFLVVEILIHLSTAFDLNLLYSSIFITAIHTRRAPTVTTCFLHLSQQWTM